MEASETSVRVLVTGSRDWDDKETLIEAFKVWWLQAEEPANPILVSGACPTGADAYAEELWDRFGWPVERHPAQWSTYGLPAGPRRNREMVEAGADICLAFIRNHSKGATGCSTLAVSAGIPVRTYRQDG